MFNVSDVAVIAKVVAFKVFHLVVECLALGVYRKSRVQMNAGSAIVVNGKSTVNSCRQVVEGNNNIISILHCRLSHSSAHGAT